LFERHLAPFPAGAEERLDRVYLHRGDVQGFAVRDFVELDCDGVRRTVTQVGRGYLDLHPPLEHPPREALSLIWNWKRNADFDLDLRLSDQSPGRGMAQGGGDVGADLDIQAYRRGDFDGDGVRDIPTLPAELARNPTLAPFLR
jgi:hypothetical protein